ncbi:hypothetical protein [Methylotuvimicrobium sp. KM1]|uniref:hypothetical protein n=1 Tax=Methylotuvimicrobium sp. KM1 TaxID=3377707 RepID=UPI00384DE2FC
MDIKELIEQVKNESGIDGVARIKADHEKHLKKKKEDHERIEKETVFWVLNEASYEELSDIFHDRTGRYMQKIKHNRGEIYSYIFLSTVLEVIDNTPVLIKIFYR